jgi:SAM-dependent methyltransferase
MTQPPDFNRLAAIYRWMEWASFGPWLSWCRCAFIPEVSACRYAAVLGDGDGRFTARLLAANSIVRIDAVDASSAMLNALVHRAGPDSARIRTYLADAREWQPVTPTKAPPDENETYDLIVTHFFLDCLTTAEVQSLAAKLRRTTSPSAVWLVSDFAIPSTLFGRAIAWPLVSVLYAAFALLTGLAVRSLPDHSTALLRSGFTLQKRRTWLGGLLISELWASNASDIAPNSTAKPL